MNELYQVVSSERSHFTQVPNIIFEYSDLSHAAFRLYIWYRRVCGSKNDNGSCWMSIETLGKKCHMDRRTVITARDKLVELGLIQIEKSPDSNGSLKITITLVDIWDLNQELQNNNSVDKKTLQNNNLYTTKQQLVHLQNNNSINIPINNIHKEQDDDVSEETSKIDQNNFSLRKGKGFITNDNKNKQSTDFSDEMVYILHNELTKKRKIMRKPNLKKWASIIRKFLSESYCTEDEFKNLLNWYIQHIGEEYIPQAYSAKSFCDNFVRLSDRMERNIEEEGEFISPILHHDDKEQKPRTSKLTEEERIIQKDEWDRIELGLSSKVEYDEYKTNWEIDYGEKYVNPLLR